MVVQNVIIIIIFYMSLHKRGENDKMIFELLTFISLIFHSLIMYKSMVRMEAHVKLSVIPKT